MNRRQFIKRGALFLPACGIFVPKLIRAASVIPQTPARGIVVAAGGGTWTFGASNNNASAGSTTTITVQLTSVSSGDTIILAVKWEGATTTSSCSDGTSSLTGATQLDNTNSDLSARFFYLLSSTATGTVTYTVTLGAARAFKSIVVMRFSHSGGTPAFDAECTAGGQQNDSVTTHTSGATLTTTGSADLLFGFHADYSGEAITGTPQINGVNQDGSDANGNNRLWYRINVAAPVTNAAAVCTTGAAASSNQLAMALKL